MVIAFSKPEYKKLIRDRVALYLKDPTSTTITSKAFDIQAMEKDPILLSFFHEVLRLKASVWSFRLVLEDAILGSGGKEYFFPKGSTLWVPVTIVHRDEEVYKDPLSFQPDRFLKVEHEINDDGKDVEKLTRKVLFSKRGKQTRMGHLPFGGGKSMVSHLTCIINSSVLDVILQDR
jgi:cytochrome P450